MDAKQFKKLAKQIGMPASSVFTDKTYPGHQLHISWEKKGGQAGAKTIQRVVERAKALGFRVTNRMEGNSPDGNVVNRDAYLQNPDGVYLYYCSYYGVTQHYNSFGLALTYQLA